MIIKFKEYIKEGVRDLMTPKSEEEIRRAFSKMIKTFNNPVTDMALEWQPEFKKIADLLGTSVDDLHLIVDDDPKYELMDDYFEDLVTGEKKEVLEVPSEGDNIGGEYKCYKSQKLAYWSSEVHDEPHVWIFSKSYFTKLNESIRDMMTPKSREEIIKNLKGRKDVDFRPTDETDLNDTGEIGRIDASYSDLVELFGEPNESPDYEKISTCWDLVDSLGRHVSIHDWKQTNLYDEDYPTVEEFRSEPSYNWIVSGKMNEEEIVEDLKAYIILHII